MPDEVVASALTRRAVILSGTALACVGLSAPTDAFAAIERRAGVRLGVAALDTATGRELGYRADERFAMCSTFKLLLAASVLQAAEQGRLRLDQRVPINAADLLEHAPAVQAHLARGAMTVAELCAAAVRVSDNAAANLLLDRTGGPAGLTRFARSIGDRVTRLDRRELALNQNLPGDPRDTTSPRAMARSARIVLTGGVLRPASRALLAEWLVTSTRGLDRLRAGLPPTWHVGTKAGTGQGGALNDVAIAWPPRRAPIVIASYLTGGTASAPVRAAAHADVARAVVAAWH